MGILDDAIKEHLELKRQHGAGESELKQLEDEAFGAAERPGDVEAPPDPLAEAPTEFMAQPDLEQDEEPGARSEASDAEAPAAEGSSRRSPRAEIADLQEPPQPSPNEDTADAQEPGDEELPALEHDVVSEPPPEPAQEVGSPNGPTTEEREAIAEQPTEMFDIEEELASSQAEAPSEEDLIEEELEEPRLAPVDPLAGLDEVAEVEVEIEVEEEYEEDDDFWDEKRLSDELDQALEAPREIEDEDEDEEEGEAELEDEPEQGGSSPAPHEEDVLEETPDFLEEAPEDDQLWFEQKPPKDFDFDD